MRSTFKTCTKGPNFGSHTHYPCNIPDLQRLCYFDLETDKKSKKVTRGQNEVKIEKYTQGLHFWHAYSYYIIEQHRL